MSLLVLGSVALDTIETERGMAIDCMGGSASHAALAASYFVRPRLVGVVGEDFPDRYTRFLASRADLTDLHRLPGKTFRWHGIHSLKDGTTRTVSTELNTYEQFRPRLSPQARGVKYAFIGNISPSLQLEVMEQLENPRLVACDTMSLWIHTARDEVLRVMRSADLFLCNEQEAFELMGCSDPREAARAMLAEGAKAVIIKRGPDPSLLVRGHEEVEVASYPDPELTDPTGAGDNFAGALMGYLAARGAGDDLEDLAEGMRYGAAVASYVIEGFGTTVHRYLTRNHLEERRNETKVLTGFKTRIA